MNNVGKNQEVIDSDYNFLWLGKGRKGKKKSKNETSHSFICM